MAIQPFDDPTALTGAVVFDATEFVIEYREFGDVPISLLRAFFDRACLLVNNSSSTKLTDAERRQSVLYLLTAHIATLWRKDAGSVGRVSEATEGSVSAKIEWAGNSNPARAWYEQTQYGVTYLMATAPYRRFSYVGPRCSSAY